MGGLLPGYLGSVYFPGGIVFGVQCPEISGLGAYACGYWNAHHTVDSVFVYLGRNRWVVRFRSGEAAACYSGDVRVPYYPEW